MTPRADATPDQGPQTAVAVATPTTTAVTVEELRTVKNVLCPDLTDPELLLFAKVCRQTGLDPFSRQIYAIKRNTKSGPRLTFQTGIDGYRAIAERTGEYHGQEPPVFGADCRCTQEPRPHPESATVGIWRAGRTHPINATAYWHEYKPQPPNDTMWNKMPRHMLAKVAEALAIRKAFPNVLGGTHTDDETAAGHELTSEAVDEHRRRMPPARTPGHSSPPSGGGSPATEPPPTSDREEVVDAEVVDASPPDPEAGLSDSERTALKELAGITDADAPDRQKKLARLRELAVAAYEHFRDPVPAPNRVLGSLRHKHADYIRDQLRPPGEQPSLEELGW